MEAHSSHEIVQSVHPVARQVVPVNYRFHAPVAFWYLSQSLGSYHQSLIWRMQHVSVRSTLGLISLPPVLLSRIPGMQGERLLLYHYTNDSLCQWKPGPDTLKALACKYCIVSNDAAEAPRPLWQCWTLLWALAWSGSLWTTLCSASGHAFPWRNCPSLMPLTLGFMRNWIYPGPEARTPLIHRWRSTNWQMRSLIGHVELGQEITPC